MNEIATTTETEKLPTLRTFRSTDIFADGESFEHAQRVAKVFAQSSLVPEHMRNLPNCMIALQIAKRLNEDPLTVMQNIFIVNGRPGWYVQYLIARVNSSGILKGRITWTVDTIEGVLTVTARGTLADTGEVISASTDMKMANDEHWTKNPKYKSMPEHMLRWRSAAMLIRLYMPEVTLGIPTVEELETLPKMRDVTPRRSLNDKLDELANGGGQQATQEATSDHDPETGEVNETEQQEGQQGNQQQATTQGNPTSDAQGTPAQGAPQQQAQATAQQTTGAAQQTTATQQGAEAQQGATQTGYRWPGPGDEPTTIRAYVEAWTVYIENLTDPRAGEARWPLEKAIRHKLRMDEEVRDTLQDDLRRKCAVLRKAKP